MLFDPDNKIIKLCAQGLALEGEGDARQALELFEKAWSFAKTDLEKLAAAHYIARHQKTLADKLKWDTIAMNLAHQIAFEEVKVLYPSLYLNIGKCHEDLGDLKRARGYYSLALTFTARLPDDRYGAMIRAGISRGIDRTDGIVVSANDNGLRIE